MTSRAKRTLIRVAVGLVFLVLFLKVLSLLSTIATVVLVSMAFAYILNPVVNKLHSYGVERPAGALLLVVTGTFVLIVAFILVMPAIIRELVSFAASWPKYFLAIHGKVLTILERFNIETPQQWDEIGTLVLEKGKALLPDVADPLARIVNSVFTSTLFVLSSLFYVLLIPVLTYYLMISFEDIKNYVVGLIPPYLRSATLDKLLKIDAALAGFIRGQLTICLILALLYSIGLIGIGIDLPIVIGTTAGALFIVPYLGTIVGLTLGSLMALANFGDFAHVLYVWLWIGAVQLLEGYVLTPNIVGHAVGLHPVVYIIAIIAGGNLFGIMGMLLAIPVTATMKVIAVTLIEAYKKSYLYQEPSAPEPVSE